MIYTGLSKIKLIHLGSWLGSDHLIIILHFERRKRTWTGVMEYCHVSAAMFLSLTECKLLSKESPVFSLPILTMTHSDVVPKQATYTGNIFGIIKGEVSFIQGYPRGYYPNRIVVSAFRYFRVRILFIKDTYIHWMWLYHTLMTHK